MSIKNLRSKEVLRSKLNNAVALKMPTALPHYITKSGIVYYERYGKVFQKCVQSYEGSTPQYVITLKEGQAVFSVNKLFLIAYHNVSWKKAKKNICGRINPTKDYGYKNVRIYKKGEYNSLVSKEIRLHSMGRFTDEEVRAFRKKFKEDGLSKLQIAKTNGVPYMTINDLLNGKTYSRVK